ncbi:hypothetical protein Tco_0053892, partial [Tanacetum coccineum]
VMAISVISVSSEDSVGTPVGRVILFDTILTTIPDTTPVITPLTTQTDTISDPSEDLSSDHIPSLPAISPFLSSTNDTTDGVTPDTPPSPTHGQPIPHGRPYRYHPNGLVHMMTARKRVRLIPIQQLAVRHFVDHSLSDYFSLDDSARDSSSNSSLEASSDFHSDASSDSSSRHSLSDYSSPDLPSTSAGPSRKRRRSPMTFVPALPPISGALSPIRTDLIPSPKRVMDSGYLADVEADPRETSLRDDCIAYADALRDRGIDSRVVVEAVDREESETGTRGPIAVKIERRFHDHTVAIPVHHVQVIEGVQREQGHRIVGVESTVTALTERIAVLERDNRRLKGTMSVESQRVDRLQCGMSRMQRELRQMRQFRFYDRVRVGRFEAKMPNTRSGASMTHGEIEDLIARRVAKKIEAHEAAMNLKPLNENGMNKKVDIEGMEEMEMEGIEEMEMEGIEEMKMEEMEMEIEIGIMA